MIANYCSLGLHPCLLLSRLRRKRSTGLAVSGVAEEKEAEEVKGEAGEQAHVV